MFEKEFSNNKVIVNNNLEKNQLADLIDELKSSLDERILEKDADIFDAEIIELSQELDKLIVEHMKFSNNEH